MAGSRVVPTKWFHDFEKTLPSLVGKRVAITGTTSGTGFIAARACLQKGAVVFVLNRDSTRAQESLQQLQKEVPGCKVEHIACDLQSFESVRQAAKELTAKCADTGLDVLSCNAGIAGGPNKATSDGLDVQMQTNHLSHFLLAKEALPVLKTAAEQRGEARIVFHSSGMRNAMGGPFDAKYYGQNGPQLGDDSKSIERYHQSKLANALFTHALAAKLGAAGLSNIKAVCAVPGMAATAIQDKSESPMLPSWVPTCLVPFQSAEDGTMPLLAGMAGTEVRSGDWFLPSSGPCWMNGADEIFGPVRTMRAPWPKKEQICTDPKSQALMWEGCEKAIGEKFTI